MRLELTRFANTPLGTFGLLRGESRDGNGELVRTHFSVYTLELPWKRNKRNLSCIPMGVYPLRRCIHNIGTLPTTDDYDAFEVVGVEGRSNIHIHIGNTINDISGCIVLGRSLGYVKGKWAVVSSRLAFDTFMAGMQGTSDVYLTITGDLNHDWS